VPVRGYPDSRLCLEGAHLEISDKVLMTTVLSSTLHNVHIPIAVLFQGWSIGLI